MTKSVLIDQFHLTVFVAAGLRAKEAAAVRRTLDGAGFRARLGRAVRGVFRQYPPLRKARITITR